MKYKLTCLTPTLVGDGRELSPMDYMIWKDRINVLDQQRIFRLFAKGPRLDGYLAQLKKADRLDFASWGGLAQNYAGRRIAFESPTLTRHFERAHTENLFVRTFAATVGGVYVPGTAIKGALRTGAVFGGWNADTFRRMSAQVQEGRLARKAVVGMEEGAVNRSMQGASAGDSSTVPYSATLVYLTRVSTAVARGGGKLELGWKQSPRGSVGRHEDSTPEFVEMVQPGTVFEGSWKDKDCARAVRSANRFAAEVLASHRKYAEMFGMTALMGAIGTLSARAEQLADSAAACLVPVGWGCGFLGKAAIADASGDEMRDLLRKLPFYTRAIQTGLPFPKTRRVVFLDDKPATLPGWCLLEIRL